MMKLKPILALMALTTASVFAVSAQPIEVEIKGLKIGMPEMEILQKFSNFDEFTIAGVRGYHIGYVLAPGLRSICMDRCFSERGARPLSIRFDDQGGLEYWQFSFASPQFGQIKAAVKEKYPSAVCYESVLVNGYGAQFQQETCTVEDDISLLSIRRYSSDRNKGMLDVTAKKVIERMKQKSEQGKKDI